MRCIKDTDKLSHSLVKAAYEKFSLDTFEMLSDYTIELHIWSATKKINHCVKYLIRSVFKNWDLKFLQLLTVVRLLNNGDHRQNLVLSHFVSGNIDLDQRFSLLRKLLFNEYL